MNDVDPQREIHFKELAHRIMEGNGCKILRLISQVEVQPLIHCIWKPKSFWRGNGFISGRSLSLCVYMFWVVLVSPHVCVCV